MARHAGSRGGPLCISDATPGAGTPPSEAGTRGGLTTDTRGNEPMRRVLLLTCAAVLGTSALAAQATGMPLYNAPYRAFQRSEIGAAVSFPSSAGTAFLGMYRMASGKLDLGFQAGIW